MYSCQCPRCQCDVKIQDDDAGELVRCSKCKKQFVSPTPEDLEELPTHIQPDEQFKPTATHLCIALSVATVAAAIAPIIANTLAIVGACVWLFYIPVAAFNATLTICLIVGRKKPSAGLIVALVITLVSMLLMLASASTAKIKRNDAGFPTDF